MIKLFNLKQEKEAAAAASASGEKPKIAPGLIRMQKDVSELVLDGKGIKVDFYNGKEDLMNFKVTISPDDGIYKGGRFVFDVKVPKTYPHDAPKVLCETTVFHPNLDMEGHVCLNILREAGADMDIERSDGKTAMQIHREQVRAQMANVMMRSMTKSGQGFKV